MKIWMSIMCLPFISCSIEHENMDKCLDPNAFQNMLNQAYGLHDNQKYVQADSIYLKLLIGSCNADDSLIVFEGMIQSSMTQNKPNLAITYIETACPKDKLDTDSRFYRNIHLFDAYRVMKLCAKADSVHQLVYDILVDDESDRIVSLRDLDYNYHHLLYSCYGDKAAAEDWEREKKLEFEQQIAY